MELIKEFKNLPNEIIQTIINYTDVIVYRYGKYINRLNKTDYRCDLLKRIPRPIYMGYYRILLRLLNNNNESGYFLEYYICDYVVRINVRFFIKENNGLNKNYNIKSNNTYIFDVNNKWYKLNNYLM